MTVEEAQIQLAKEAYQSFWIWIFPISLIIFFLLTLLYKKYTPKEFDEWDPPFIKRWWKVILFFVAIGAFSLRIWNIDYTGIHIDEANHYLMARNIADNGEWSYYSGLRDFSGIDITAGIAIIHSLTGGKNIELTARLPSVILGSLATISAFFVTFFLSGSRTTGLLGAFIWALDPFAIFWSRYARFYSSMAFWLLTTFSLLHIALTRKKFCLHLISALTTVATIFSRGLLILPLPLITLILAARRRCTHAVVATALTATIVLSATPAYILLVNIKDPYAPSITMPAIETGNEKLNAFISRLIVFIPNVTPATFGHEGRHLYQCAERFFWNNLAALPWFMIAGFAGFGSLLFLFRHRSPISPSFLATATIAVAVTYMMVAKCQIRMQWMVHIYWIIFSALFLGVLFHFSRWIIQRHTLPRWHQPLAYLVLVVLLIISVNFLTNLRATKKILLLKPGDPSPFYYYFSVSKQWVEDSRSPGQFVHEHIGKNDLVITSMWQYLAYFLDRRDQFRGILLMHKKPTIGAYVTGGNILWEKEQVFDLIKEARKRGGGLWVIYDQTKELDPALRERYLNESNLQYVGMDGKTQVYYLH